MPRGSRDAWHVPRRACSSIQDIEAHNRRLRAGPRQPVRTNNQRDPICARKRRCGFHLRKRRWRGGPPGKKALKGSAQRKAPTKQVLNQPASSDRNHSPSSADDDWFPDGGFWSNVPKDTAIDALRAEIGDEQALHFWHAVIGRGAGPGRSRRRQVYIPKASRLRSGHWLIEALGADDARKVCALFSGQTQDFGIAKFAMREAARQHVLFLYENGQTVQQIAAEVSIEYPVTEDWVRRKLKSNLGF